LPDEHVVKHSHHRELINCIVPVLLVWVSVIGDEQILWQFVSPAQTNEGAIPLV
jgi:hypothetical protein